MKTLFFCYKETFLLPFFFNNRSTVVDQFKKEEEKKRLFLFLKHPLKNSDKRLMTDVYLFFIFEIPLYL